jgi:peptidoglycan-N-acetylglucosamine deacetylase
VHPGSIVVLHDGGGNRTATLAALPLIVHGIRHRHLHLVTLDAGR